MFQPRRKWSSDCSLVSLAIITLFVIAFSTPAIADCEVGTRVFVQTLTLDAPCVDDELLLPAVSFQDETEIITGELDKTITENFGVGLQEQWVQLKLPGEDSHSGFDNLQTQFNYQLVRNSKSETAMTAALVVNWGGTGNRAVGADPFTTLTPTWNGRTSFFHTRLASRFSDRRRRKGLKINQPGLIACSTSEVAKLKRTVECLP